MNERIMKFLPLESRNGREEIENLLKQETGREETLVKNEKNSYNVRVNI